MSRLLILCTAIACTVGCGKHELRTNNLIRLVPAKVHVSADPIAMQPQVLRDRSPLKTMPVQAGSCRKIALIDVDGLLVNQNQAGIGSMGDNPLDIFREKLDQVEREGDISAVIIRINSYGGGVTASDIMRRELEAFRERTGMPIVAVLMDIATGGGYLLATAADQIVAHPTTIVGGFGVILNLYNLEDAMAQFNVAGQTIRAGKFVDIGSPERFLEEDEEELLTEIAEQYNARFKDVVLRSRQRIHPDVEIFDGRIFTGTKAEKLGVVDQVGYIDDAIAAARAYAGDPNACVVMLHREQDKARTPYATTPNEPTQLMAMPQIPGLMRSRLPTFMYIWQPDPGLAP
ncbi:S49 family peptidase [Rosistilla oblonga]|uniref:S49 family peptidase n=1 Tax=Rosistilla oblonga TaxID=2527990 RepID=UPI003A973AC0